MPKVAIKKPAKPKKPASANKIKPVARPKAGKPAGAKKTKPADQQAEAEEMLAALSVAAEVVSSPPVTRARGVAVTSGRLADLTVTLPDDWDHNQFPVLKIANWLTEISLTDLAEKLVALLHRHKEKITDIQKHLLRALPPTIDEIKTMYLYFDRNQYFVGSLLAETGALLDKAQQATLLACGTSAICIDEETGDPIPATGCKVAYGHVDFQPKYKELTETDRKTRQDSDVAAFRRLRDELRAMDEALRNRLFNIKGLIRLDQST